MELIMEEKTGTIIFQKINEGSKSEKLQPFLYISKDEIIPIFFKGSNPFENNELAQFDGKLITVEGHIENTTFIIQKIKENQN